MRLRRLQGQLVGILMRWLRLRVRRLERRYCRGEAAKRRLLVLLARRLVRKVDRQQRRALRLVLPWSEVEDQRRRRVWLQLRRLVREVQVPRRHRRRQARQQELRWRLMVDRHRRRAEQQAPLL